MSKQILISLIVKDLPKSTAFYTALGFMKKSDFESEKASQMSWSEDITFMLLDTEMAKMLNARNKDFVDQKKTVSAVFSFMLDSKESVDQFCKNAAEAGGTVFTNEDEIDETMYTFEVEDPDGYILQPMFMDLSKFPGA